MTDDFTVLSATEIARRVQRREIDPSAVVAQHLERIDRLNPQLNAFQAILRDEAIANARALAQRNDLAALPLAGVPAAIKDNTDVAGVPTRQGSAATSTNPAPTDDLLVRRLRDAGAIVVGTTRMPELAIWPFTESRAFGDTRNPWNVSRGAGGSSGGSAAAVAARMVPIALGSDGAGSIRVPAASCGVVGFKPAANDVPLAGGGSEHWLGSRRLVQSRGCRRRNPDVRGAPRIAHDRDLDEAPVARRRPLGSAPRGLSSPNAEPSPRQRRPSHHHANER